jgi:hypothetical protein
VPRDGLLAKGVDSICYSNILSAAFPLVVDICVVDELPTFPLDVALRAGAACLELLPEVMMKGRRKVISHRWSLQAQFELDVSRTLAKRPNKDAHRFLDAALVFGRDFEPIGRLAGGSRSPNVKEP